MKISYCLPIIKNEKSEVLKIIEQQKNNYQYFEVWLDYIDDLDEVFVKKLINDLQEKLVILFRRQNLEKINMNLDERIKIISLLNNSASFLDLDITTQKEEINYINKNKLKLKTILSYHNYEETPTDLDEIIKTMQQDNPTIYKIATLCKTEKDALRLLQLLLALKEQNKKAIILGMGEFGTITRVFGTLWGNEMIFAPIDETEASAPGQLTKQQLENIFSNL